MLAKKTWRIVAIRQSFLPTKVLFYTVALREQEIAAKKELDLKERGLEMQKEVELKEKELQMQYKMKELGLKMY